MKKEALPESPDTRPRLVFIALTLVFSLAGYLLPSAFINMNIIQYTTLPQTVILKVENANTNRQETIPLRVTSVIPVDSIKEKPVTASGPIIKEIVHHENPMFLVWRILICIMIALAAGACPYLVTQFLDIRKRFVLTRSQTGFAISFSLLILLYLYASNFATKGYYRPQQIIDDFNILLRSGNLLDGMVAATIILIYPAFLVIFMNMMATDNIIGRKHDEKSIIRAAADLEYLNKILLSMLQFLAIIVVFSVLTSSALRESIKATIKIEGYDIFPTEVSYVYGLHFSLFLFIMYIPAHMYLKYQSGRLRSVAESIKSKNSISDETWIETQLAPLKFKESVFDQFKVAFTVLAPLITGFLPQSLHIFD